MMCAVADLPTPESRIGAMTISLVIFPVKMNVLDEESGSSANPMAACCAATNALTVLTFKSRVKSATGIESGSFGGLTAAALASLY